MSEAGMEQKYIQEAFDTNWVVPLGGFVFGYGCGASGTAELRGEAGR